MDRSPRRPVTRRAIAALLLLLASLAFISRSSAAPKVPPASALVLSMREDARLNDVSFIDAQTGWAVGDRGVVWHTDDGGRNWRLQESGVEGTLTSVFFLDALQGWIAGGTTQPGTLHTTAILLRTRDGGRRWEAEDKLLLPALKKVKFLTLQVGWAIGESSPLFPSGVFATDNGGRTWTPLPGSAMHDWLAGDFIDPNSGAVAGRHASLAAIRRRKLVDSPISGIDLQGMRTMKLDATGQGWLVGDGALVLSTDDLGVTWQAPTGELPRDVAQHFDFQALASHGPHGWIAGSPGSRVLHTSDSGRTWQLRSTGQTLPLSALAFADAQHGWAVGSLGTILATHDGGQTWKRQRGGGARTALLGIYSEAAAVPLELWAKLCGNDGYLGVVQVLGRRDLEADSAAEDRQPERLHEAVTAVGGSDTAAAWQFPLRQRGLTLPTEQLVDGWNRIGDGQGLERLEALIVRQIRVWRPDVLFTHTSSPRGDDPLGHLINQVVLRAIDKAGDATRYGELAAQAGLEPWKVKKVYTGPTAGQAGSTQLETAQLAPRWGRSLAEQATIARALLTEQFSSPPPLLGFRLSLGSLTTEAAQRDFFSGIVLHPGGEARRTLAELPGDGLDLLRRVAQKQRTVEAVLDRAGNDALQSTQLVAQVESLIGDLEAPTAGRLLYQMGQRYIQAGRWELAAETFDLLATKYPEHAMTPAAQVWLVQYWSSGEAAWRDRSRQGVTVDDRAPADRASRATALGKTLEGSRPAVAADPAVRFALAAAYRSQNEPREAERILLNLRSGRPRDAWWRCADGERWLAEPRSAARAKEVWPCRPAAAKPRLDGRLNDELWAAAQQIPLASPLRDDAAWPAIAMLAYDDEFLYLAASCRQAPSLAYPVSDAPRPRDANLAQHDRVEFCLDIDRDFATCYHLSIDHRGWTAEDCWGDASWNPTWFVAAHTADGVWTIEAAIPLDELTGDVPAAKDVWALGVQRTAPGVGFQSWSTPAAIELRPEGFGYLLFETGDSGR